MKILVLDGNSILNRAFYGIKILTTKEGLYTNGIYGFLMMLQKLLDEVQPDSVAIAFDLKGPTFRHKKYAGYKANRHGMPEELAQQMPTLKELLKDLGYHLVTCEGYEADDILGTFSKACAENGNTCVIATGDRDSLQLVGPYTSVRLASTKFGQPQVMLYTEEKVKEIYGVTPKEMIEIKALQGDSSDCIPGVPGIGPKGAGELIQNYHSIDYIYDHLDELPIKEGMRKKLREGKESAYLSRELGTICLSAPVDTDISHYVPFPIKKDETTRLMTKLELFKLMEKLELQNLPDEAPKKQEKIDHVSLFRSPAPDLYLPELEKKGEAPLLAFYRKDGSIETLAVAVERGACLLEKPEEIRSLLGNPKTPVITYDVKSLQNAAAKDGIFLKHAKMDVLLAAYLLDPSAAGYDFDRLCQEYGVSVCEVWKMENPVPEDLLPENQKKAERFARVLSLPGLFGALSKKIAEAGQEELLSNIELPLAWVLSCMEREGFAVDAEGIKKYGESMQSDIETIQKGIFEEVGYEFNLNSPKQLGDALFVKLGLPHGKKTKSGYSTSAAVLESLQYENPVISEILRYRSLSKLKSTYCDGLLKVIGEDGRIHSSFNQTETRTGRISSTEPNLQNIPVRSDQGRELRRFFVARPGWVLVDADYSQIELRVLAHVANDENMRQAFLNGDDIHRATASQVFHMPEEMVTPLMRSRAKAVNFGIVYGIGAFSLSKDIGVSRREADQYIKDYLAHYSGIDEYMKKSVELAKERGYAETIFGRRRYLPELRSSNFNLRSFGERVARNMPIQGAAADIIKIAMIKVQDRLEKEHMKSKLILQVHDELIVEAPREEASKAASLLREEMEGAVSLSVPMVAEATIGKTWYEAKS